MLCMGLGLCNCVSSLQQHKLLKSSTCAFAGEEEYLFAPYSAFTVVKASWNRGTDTNPHIVELLAAVDNKEVREDLPLAPWS